MAKVGAQRAAELTGRSKSTIQRAMNGGKLPFELDANGRRVIDVAELEKTFGLDASVKNISSQKEQEKAAMELEMDRLKMRVKILEEQIQNTHAQIEDLKTQRDQWQKQAEQSMAASEFSHKQVEELRNEIKERERRARERRQQRMDHQVKGLKAENQNSVDVYGDEYSGFTFKNLWRRVRNF